MIREYIRVVSSSMMLSLELWRVGSLRSGILRVDQYRNVRFVVVCRVDEGGLVM